MGVAASSPSACLTTTISLAPLAKLSPKLVVPPSEDDSAETAFLSFLIYGKQFSTKLQLTYGGPLPTVNNQFWIGFSKSLFDRLAICRANEKFAVINLLHKVGHFLLPNGNSVKFKGKPYVYLCLESNQCEFLYCLDMLLPLRLKVPLNC